MSYDDYCLLPDDGRQYQGLEVALLMSPAPRPRHQAVAFRLAMLLAEHAEESDLGEIFIAPIDVVLARMTVVQPDVLVISKDRAGIVTERNIQGPPDLCIEVLSPASEQTDRLTKRNVYARYGIQEYWIVDSDRGTIMGLTLQDGNYVLLCEAMSAGADRIRSTIFLALAITAR